MYTSSDTRLEWLGKGLLFMLDPNKCWRAKMQPMFESFPGPLFKSGIGLLARYANHQETINRRLEQMYTPSDTRLEWPREGPLFQSDSNKHWEPKPGPLFKLSSRPLLKSCLQPLGRYGTHQEIIRRRLEQIYTLSDTRLEWPGEGPLFE